MQRFLRCSSIGSIMRSSRKRMVNGSDRSSSQLTPSEPPTGTSQSSTLNLFCNFGGSSSSIITSSSSNTATSRSSYSRSIRRL